MDLLRYGYQWWRDELQLGNKQISLISAMGLGGQRIYIVPAYGLVVVITAGHYDDISQDWVSFEFSVSMYLQLFSDHEHAAEGVHP